ncbi:MAG: sugar ABC transporter substrate-binding protein [Acidobacteria bacterium]|nr:MAG: sugar ABC transporter substrate-binding protein [Acidobacteriota bacterium]
MTTHPRIVSSVLTLSTVALCLSAPVSAAGKDPDDKKASQSAPALVDDYRLDKLRIEVYRDTQMSQSVQIRPDGKITLPLLGDLEATGRTPIELRDVIAKQLKEYMTNPVVTVIVVEATPAVAYVTGEVNHPGAVTIQSQLTVLQALAIAGGLKDFANAKNIRILRRSSLGVQTIAFNYKDAIRGSAPVYLRPGDTVVVPD